MPFDLVPRSIFPRIPSFWDEDEDMLSLSPASSGLSIYEDEKNVFVEAAVPGIDPKNVEVTYDKGILWVRGNQEMEEKDKNKKYYRKAAKSFSYRVAVPGNIDENAEPQATIKNGVMKVTFARIPETKPKKITVKEE